MIKRAKTERDGASEVVVVHAARTPKPVVSLESVARGAAYVQPKRQDGRNRFVMLRRPGGVVKLASTHIEVAQALMRLYIAHRVEGRRDPGVTAGEVATILGSKAGLDYKLNTLQKNGVIRTKKTSVGHQATRVHYYPTELGDELIRLALYFEDGVILTVNKPLNAFRSRGLTEPKNLFDFAALGHKKGQKGSKA